jgi:hypothetical protein
MSLKFTMTQESITVFHGGEPHTVVKGDPRFANLKKALYDERWDDATKHLTIAKSLTEWLKGLPAFTVTDQAILFTKKTESGEEKSEPVPASLSNRIRTMSAKGEDPTRFFKFWMRLQENPSFRSVQQLWGFLEHEGIPLTKDGCLLAYKSVRSDLYDHHSGTIKNQIGRIISLPRNQISDDPREACHYGLHVGALGYASTFGSGPSVIVMCKVDPKNVVCVPYDASQQKMRVCEYKVVGIHNGQLMDSTSYDEENEQESEMFKNVETIDVDEPETSVDTEETPEESSANDEAVTGRSIVKDVIDNAQKITEHKTVKKSEPLKVKESTTPTIKYGALTPDEAKEEAKLFKRLDKLDFTSLMGETIGDLRHYASKKLKILGASKIPGGKTQLVTKIVEIRK